MTAGTETARAEVSDSRVGNQEIVHKEGPTVTGRQVAARLQGSAPGEDIPAPHVRIVERGEEEGPLYSPQRSDLKWWQRFLEEWNGVSMIAMSGGTELHLYSDASGSFVCGAWQNNRWFQFAWPADYAGQELVPIVMACVLWGEAWRNQQIVAHCAIVEVVNAGYCKDPALMQLLRCLFFVTAYFELAMRAVHVPGHLNSWADAISRNNAGLFLSQATEASRTPSPVPRICYCARSRTGRRKPSPDCL